MSYDKVFELLDQKRCIFKEIELATEPMYFEEVDAINLCMEKRTSLLVEVEHIDAQIKILCAEDPLLRQALNNSCDRHGLSMDLAKIYDASTQVFAIINRLISNQSTITNHLEDEKNRIQDKIKVTESSSYSVSNQYHQSVKTGSGRIPVVSFGRKI